jgi:hypothetical protein
MIKIQFLKNWSGHKLFIYEFTFFKLFTSHLKLVTGRVTQLIDHFKLVAGHDKKNEFKKKLVTKPTGQGVVMVKGCVTNWLGHSSTKPLGNMRVCEKRRMDPKRNIFY